MSLFSSGQKEKLNDFDTLQSLNTNIKHQTCLMHSYLVVSGPQWQVNPKVNLDTFTTFPRRSRSLNRTGPPDDGWLPAKWLRPQTPKPQQRISSSWLAVRGPVLLNGQHMGPALTGQSAPLPVHS